MRRHLFSMAILPIISAVLLYLSFPNIISPDGFGYLAWVSQVPLFIALRGRRAKQRIVIGSIFGVVFYSSMAWWLVSYNGFGYVFFVCILFSHAVLFCFLYDDKKAGRGAFILYVPSLWVLSEFFRTLLLNGFAWTIGHSQSFYPPVISIAAFTGAYGISFCIVLVNYSLYTIVANRKIDARSAVSILGVCVVLFAVAQSSNFVFSLPQERAPVHVCVVQANVDPHDKIDEKKLYENVNRNCSLTNQCFASGIPDLIVWPETAVADDFREDMVLHDMLKNRIISAGTSFLIGGVLRREGRQYNVAALFNRSAELLGVYEKQKLVPFSEYLPFGKIGQQLKKVFAFDNYSFSSGQGRVTLGSLGVAICNEDLYPSLFRAGAQQHAAFFVTLLNDGWLQHPSGLAIHAQNSIMRAVENHIPVVRAANTGWSMFIDSQGRFQEKEPKMLNEAGIKRGEIHVSEKKSIYSKYGDIFALICVAYVVLYSVVEKKIKGDKHGITS